MQAAILYGPHDFRIEDRPTPTISSDMCLVRVRACGVCHSEIHQWDQKNEGLDYPRFIGHEVSGEIFDLGKNVRNFKVGDRVAVWTEGGGYAEEVAVKSKYLTSIADDIPFDHALAEPLSCTTNGIIKADIQMGDSVALVGMGFMGLILLQQIKLRGPSFVVAIDIRDDMCLIAKELGADVVINPEKEDTVKRINELTQGRGIDISFEIGGVQSTLDIASAMLRMEGKLVIFGYHPGPRQISDLGYWNWMAYDIINAHFRDENTILRGAKIGMHLLNLKKINMAPLITHKYPMNNIEDAFLAAKEKEKGFVKSVIVFG